MRFRAARQRQHFRLHFLGVHVSAASFSALSSGCSFCGSSCKSSLNVLFFDTKLFPFFFKIIRSVFYGSLSYSAAVRPCSPKKQIKSVPFRRHVQCVPDFIGSLFLSAEAVTICLFAAGAVFAAFYRQTERAVANAFFHHLLL